MSTEDEVRNASTQFYAGLNRMANGNADSLADSWSHSAAVTVMHPIGGRQVGWDAVSASFEEVAQLATDGQIELKDQLIHVAGDLAYEVGIEHGRVKLAGQPVVFAYRFTNIYQRTVGLWKLIHHHTDTSPAMLAVLSRLQAGAEQTGG